MYATFDSGRVTIFPIRYEDKPGEKWSLDTSLFESPTYTKSYSIPGRDASQQVSSSPSSACDNGMVTVSGRPEIISYERYREGLRNQFGIVASRGLDNYQDIEFPLEDVFIDLHISELYGKVDAYDKGHTVETKKISQDALLQEIFHGNARTNVLLLIGDPGSGKTTLLQHYAMLCLEGDHGRLFPEAASFVGGLGQLCRELSVGCSWRRRPRQPAQRCWLPPGFRPVAQKQSRMTASEQIDDPAPVTFRAKSATTHARHW